MVEILSEIFSSSVFSSIIGYIVGVLTILLFIQKRDKNGHNIPGPTGWPFLGYVQFILSDRPTFLLNDLREKYGNIFGFQVGSRYCVVLSDFKSLKAAFNKKEYLRRPPQYMRLSLGNKNLAEMEGTEWEDHRLFFTNSFKFLGVGRNRFEEIVLDELSRVIPKMKFDVGKPECNIRNVITGSINNTLFQLLCSQWFEDSNPVMKDLTHFQLLTVESFSNNMAFLYYPWLDPILGRVQPHMKAVLAAMAKMEKFFRSELESRELIHNENNTHDYIDLYLTEMKARQKRGITSSFTENRLVANLLLFLLAGTDTVRNSLEWAFMCMAHFPEVQEKVFNEILSVLGSERMPLSEDRGRLPYTEAVIMETERWMTLVPLNVLRWTTEETVIQGYTIPKETVIINNLWYTHMDPEIWTSPKEFMPERFLSSDGKRVVTPEHFIPFSLGKRDCPGNKMAIIEMFMYFTAIVQKFKLIAPKGGVDFSASHRMNVLADRPVVKVELR